MKFTQYHIRTMNRKGIVSLVVAMVLLSAFEIAAAPAWAVADPAILKRLSKLLENRSYVERQIENAKRRLHKLELDRGDKLEELGELYRARAELSQRRQFTESIEAEIASQKGALHRIEMKRSDCLEELDGLYRGLSQIDHDVADYRNQPH